MKKVIHLQQEDTLAYRPICNKYTNHLHCLLFISSCSLYPSNFEGAVGHKASQSTLPVVGFCPRYMYVIYKMLYIKSIQWQVSGKKLVHTCFIFCQWSLSLVPSTRKRNAAISPRYWKVLIFVLQRFGSVGQLRWGQRTQMRCDYTQCGCGQICPHAQ